MNKAEYAQYLDSDHWKELRKRKIAYDESKKRKYVCNICNSKRHLHLHHKTYKRIGKEYLSDLIWLCGECHRMVHEEQRYNKDLTVVEIKMAWLQRNKKKKPKAIIINRVAPILAPPIISPSGELVGGSSKFSIYKQRKKVTSGEKPQYQDVIW